MIALLLKGSVICHAIFGGDAYVIRRTQNSTNIIARNIMCRGGEGIAFGSLGQYQQFVSQFTNAIIYG